MVLTDYFHIHDDIASVPIVRQPAWFNPMAKAAVVTAAFKIFFLSVVPDGSA